MHPPLVKSPYPFRLWAALAIVPFIDAAVAYMGFPLVWAMRGHPGRLVDPAGVAFSFAVISGVLGLLVTWARAVPVVGWLAKRGPISLPTALSGAVVWFLGIYEPGGTARSVNP